MTKMIDLAGQRFGKLLALNNYFKKYGRIHWSCQCDCGNQTSCSSLNLRQGRSRACTKCCNNIHGHASRTGRSPTYNSWLAMIARCHGPNPPGKTKRIYKDREISVCKRWRKFDNFLADMGERPNGKSIDRINGAKGYYKSNCRWATQKEQMRNTSNNVRYEYEGQMRCIAEIAELLNVPDQKLRDLLRGNKRSISDAITYMQK